ncbi:MAG: hypothetical protein GOP50_10565 [Candidatus Heimdallarchaeota archaeon]|nr:hypothetical protein [Candidatus Heimdallarchaeota archaeon]
MKQEIQEEMERFRVSEFEKIAESIQIPMSDGATIRVFKFTPSKKDFNGYSLVLSVGWGTVVPAWDALLMDAAKDFEVVYVESREKGSSDVPKTADLGLERMAKDLHEAIKFLKIEDNKLILLGSCIGATMVILGMHKNMYNPFMPVLIAPPARFELPPGLRYLIPFSPTFLWKPAQPVLRWWVIKSKSEDARQAAKYLRTLEEADVKKWKKQGLRLAYKRYWWLFPLVKNHVLLIAAETDKMHDAKVTKKVEGLMENTTYVNMGSNKNTHAPLMSEKIREFIPQFVGKNH